MPADPGRSGRPLRRSRRRVGAHRARADGGRRAARRSRRRAGGQVLGGARALPRLPARRLRLPAAQHRLPEERARLPLRRRGTVGHRLRPEGSAERVAALRPEAHGADARERHGDAARPGGRPADDLRHRRLEARRRRGDPLHVGNDRTAERRDAHPSQPREQRADAGAIVGLHPRRRAAARAADLSRARPVRRLPLRAAGGRADALAREVRRRGSARAPAARHGDDGRADVLHAPPRAAVVRRRRLPLHAALRLRLRAAPRRDLRRISESGPDTRSSSATG